MSANGDDARLELLAKKVVKMKPGSRSTVCKLVRRLFPGVEVDDRELFGLTVRLAEQCEADGVIPDWLHHHGLREGPPQNLDFVARRIVNLENGPVSLDEVEGIALSLGGHGDRESFVMVRDFDGKPCWRVEAGADGVVRQFKTPRGKTRRRNLGQLRRALEVSQVHRWERSYIDHGIVDGTQWEFQLNLTGGRVIVSHGSNAYPEGFDALQSALRMAVMRSANDVGLLADEVEGSANLSRLRVRWLCERVYGEEPAEGELPALLEELEAECARRGIELDFSEWERLSVGPRHNQAFVVRKKPSFYVRRLFGRI